MAYLYGAIVIFFVVFVYTVTLALAEDKRPLNFEEYKVAVYFASGVAIVLVAIGAFFFEFLPWILIDVLWRYV